jgi:GAG-pre-integrase domain
MGENGIFKLNLRRIEEKCLKVNKEDEAWIWYMRFEHLGYSGLRYLVKKQSVQGLSNLEFEKKFYEGCVIEKQMRRSFGKSQYQAKRPFELIHTDICRPITPGSFSGKRYFITFIESIGCTSSKRNLRHSRSSRSSRLWSRSRQDIMFEH